MRFWRQPISDKNHGKPETKRYSTKTTNPEAHDEFQAIKSEAEANSKSRTKSGWSGRSEQPCMYGDRSKCDCMSELTVRKDGPNNGRRFYSCQQCNYFSWLWNFYSYTRDHWTIDPVLGRPRTWPTNDLQDFSRLHYRAAFPNRLAHLEPTPTLCSVLYSQTYCLQYQLNPLTFQVAWPLHLYSYSLFELEAL